MLRFLGALLVVAGAGGFGYLIAGSIDEHAATLRRLIAALQHLESDITFASVPLLTALRNAARAGGGTVGAFLAAVADQTARNDGQPLARTWHEVLGVHKADLLLTPAEVEVLERLGMVLGGSDREDQQKHLAMAQATLGQCSAEADGTARRTKRVWRYLGFTLGALAVVVLY